MNNADNSKTTILVLLRLDDDAVPVLTTALKLAETMNGLLCILSVKEPLEVVSQENQLSAKKELYEDFLNTQERLEKLLKDKSDEVDYKVVYGNVKQSVLEALEAQKPTITVLGKRTKKLAGILGDRLTQAVIDNKNTSVFIVDPSVGFEDHENLSLGLMGKAQDANHQMIQYFKANSKKEVTYFRMEGASEEKEDTSQINSFVFPKGENGFKSLANYASKKNTHLFCIPKATYENLPKKFVHTINSNVFVLN